MDIIILPQHWSCFIIIAVIIGTLIVAYLRKWMITHALILANGIAFIFTILFYDYVVFGYPYITNPDFAGLGFKSLYLQLEYSPQLYTLLTSQFIHGGIAHLLGNMFVLFFAGTALEERIGGKKYLFIYIIAGIVAALAQSLFGDFLLPLSGESSLTIPLIGASGAIFGILGALVFSYPRDKIVMPIPLLFIMIIRRVRVIVAVIIFAFFETAIVFFQTFSGSFQDNTAHLAHIGGLIGGMVLAAIIIGKNTHRQEGKTIFYGDLKESIPDEDIITLRKLATTPELQNILDRIEHENVGQVREIWLDHFFEKAQCPKCGKKLKHRNRIITCENCGFTSKY